MNMDDAWIEEWEPCSDGVRWLKKQRSRKDTVVLRKLIKEKKYDWANWAIVRCMEYKQYVSYAVFAAEQVIDIYEKKYPNEDRPRKAIEAANKCIKNPSEKNKSAAATAYDVAYAVAAATAYDVATYAVYAATYAVYAAAAAAAAAYAAAYATTYVAAYASAAATAYDADDALRKKILKYGMTLLGEAT